MSEVRRKVLLDLFAAPSTLLPLVGGVTALIASWALGNDPALTFAGIAGMLSGVGMFTTRLIFGIEQMTEQAYEYVESERRESQEAALADLERRLVQDGDTRTEALLRALRQLYAGFLTSIRAQGEAAVGAVDVHDKVDEMFQVCVEQLEQSLALWQTAQPLNGKARQRVLDQREEILREVQLTVDHIGSAVQRYQGLKLRKKNHDLARLREQLDESLQAARAAEQRMAEWESSPPDQEKE